MDKVEAKKKATEIVLYLLDTYDKEIVDHYVDMIMEILESYADEVSREDAVNFLGWICDKLDGKMIDGDMAESYYEWYQESNQEESK